MPGLLGHRVLVGTEAREHDLHHMPQAEQRSPTRGRPRAVGFIAERRVRKPIQHVPVGVVEARPGRWRPPDRGLRRAELARRRLPVLGIEVPPSPAGLLAVHQVPRLAATPSIEVLHRQAPGLIGGPRGEVLVVTQELVRPHQSHVVVLEQAPAPPRQRLGGHDLARTEGGTVLGQAAHQRARTPMVDLEAGPFELAGEPAHGGEHHMEALAVEALRPDLGLALDQQDPRLSWLSRCERADRAVELIAEYPNGPQRLVGLLRHGLDLVTGRDDLRALADDDSSQTVGDVGVDGLVVLAHRVVLARLRGVEDALRDEPVSTSFSPIHPRWMAAAVEPDDSTSSP